MHDFYLQYFYTVACIINTGRLMVRFIAADICLTSRCQLSVSYLPLHHSVSHTPPDLREGRGLCALYPLQTPVVWAGCGLSRLFQDSTWDFLRSVAKPRGLICTLIIRSSSSRSMQPLPSISYSLKYQRSFCCTPPFSTRLRAATYSMKSMKPSYKRTGHHEHSRCTQIKPYCSV